jgi:prepilin-type N-terminal cleavage/methylation domain-containing protein
MKPLPMSERGFSLVEMAVVLAVTGILGLATWKLMPSLRPVATRTDAQTTLLEVQQALDGFIVQSFRLPCPDTDDDGKENCAITSKVGKLPWRTLKLSVGQGLRYGVYRNANDMANQDADLALFKDRYIPTLPTGNSSIQHNGLDFCWALRMAAAAPADLTAGGVPVAYALAHPGQNTHFDGDHTTPSGFELMAKPATATYDDKVLAVGLTELSGRLGCVQRLAEVQGAARAAYAAYDLHRNAGMYKNFRALAYDVSVTNLAMAGVSLALAHADEAAAFATSTTAVAIAASTKGLSMSIATGALAIGAAIAARRAAQIALNSATKSLDTAKKRKTAATTHQTDSFTAWTQALTAAKNADQKGLNP